MVTRYGFEAIVEGLGECNGIGEVEEANGGYVKHSDYEDLETELEEVKQELEQLQAKISDVYMSY